MSCRLKYLVVVFAISMLFLSFIKKSIVSEWEASDKTDITKVYEKAMEWFSKNTNCKVDVKYFSFKDYTSTTAYDQLTGYYKRDKDNIHSFALGINTIQNAKMCLVIDSVNTMIIVKNKSDLKQPLFDAASFSQLLDNVKAMKKQKSENNETVYRIEFKPNELYTATELVINDKGLITVVKYYYSKELKEDEDDPKTYKGRPRMEVHFDAYQTDVNFNYDKEFSEKKYLKEEAGKIVLNEVYKKYELKDYRFAMK
jgi:hypothetical protein